MPFKDKKKYNTYLNNYMKERYVLRRQKAVTSLGGKCRCGATEDLHFHHLEDKEFSIARGSSVSDKRWNEELKKCILLCETCHKAEHYGSIAQVGRALAF